MSSNVELVGSIYAAWKRGDYGSAEWAHREIEFVMVDGPEPGTRMGHSGLATVTRDLLSPWADARAFADEYRELDAERLLVLVSHSGRSKAGGVESDRTQSKGAWLFHVRDGKVTRIVRYWDRDRAVADLRRAGGATRRD